MRLSLIIILLFTAKIALSLDSNGSDFNENVADQVKEEFAYYNDDPTEFMREHIPDWMLEKGLFFLPNIFPIGAFSSALLNYFYTGDTTLLIYVATTLSALGLLNVSIKKFVQYCEALVAGEGNYSQSEL